MRHIIYADNAYKASIAILVKDNLLHKVSIESAYIKPIGVKSEAFIAYSLWYNEKDKCPATEAKEYMKDILNNIIDLDIKFIICTDSNYFKYLSGESKVTTSIGLVKEVTLKGYEQYNLKVFYIPNYKSFKYNPQSKLVYQTCIAALQKYIACNKDNSTLDNIVESACYPETIEDISAALCCMLSKDALSIDIETLGLSFWKCGIQSIAFAWDKHNFISFVVDRHDKPKVIKELLKLFFEDYEGKAIYHNANFDLKVLTYELFMDSLYDYEGMLDGIDILTRDIEDTKLIVYLATNNAVENNLKLKHHCQEYLGQYALEEISDVSNVSTEKLLLYNGLDCLGTWYVYEKYYPIMIQDNQQKIYETLFKPAIATVLHMELHGMPIHMDKIIGAKKQISDIVNKCNKYLQNSPIIKEFIFIEKEQLCVDKTNKAKRKIYTTDDPVITKLQFNPASKPQVARLIIDFLGYPILDYTKTKQPSVGGKTLKKYLNRCKPEHKKLFETLIELAKADKILSSFIPAFEQAIKHLDGTYRLYGNFNIGGCVSGRMSSSSPNLQNIPSHSHWAEIIKACFGGTNQWLFTSADFNSLEDMISALTTKDPNKLKVYTDGYDGHCLRAYAYFPKEMPDIENTVESINSIKTKYEGLRQKSKAPTFLLTYGGTAHGLINSLGLSQKEADSIEENYHKLYVEADNWVANKIQQACVDGYVTGAFGLRLRTPLLKNNSRGKLLYLSAAEGRTAGNMLGQSYCMLNMRAANEFRQRILKSEYKYDIFICGQIHDAVYVYHRNTLGIVAWINKNLIECMQWNELPEIQHPTVKLGAELEIHYPNWNACYKIKNNASKLDIYKEHKTIKDK